MSLPPAAQALVNSEMLKHKHPNDLDVIEHPNYGPRVKLKCRVCPAETYVRIVPEQTEEEAQVAYMKRLIDLEKDGERTTVVLGPFSAMTIIGLLQLATRHPDMDRRTKDIARDLIHQMEPLFAGTEGEEIIRRGGHPEFDK
jgi:hypothetical protein